MSGELRRDLGDGLPMRAARSEADVARLAIAHESFGEAELEPLTLDLLRHRPHVSWDDFIVVEDTNSGDLVSSICLLPETWAYEDVILRVAEGGSSARARGIAGADWCARRCRCLRNGCRSAAIGSIWG